jgi:hypothetical protein
MDKRLSHVWPMSFGALLGVSGHCSTLYQSSQWPLEGETGPGTPRKITTSTVKEGMVPSKYWTLTTILAAKVAIALDVVSSTARRIRSPTPPLGLRLGSRLVVGIRLTSLRVRQVDS